MPLIKRPCGAPGCANLVERGFCARHVPRVTAIAKQYDDHRGSATERGYDSAWRRFRKWFLSLPENIICADCKREAATDVHHVKKVRYFPDRKLDPSNCLGLCHGCHSARTFRGE